MLLIKTVAINYKKLYEIQCKKLLKLEKSFNLLQQTKKGHLCSVNGGKYENEIYNIVRLCSINNNKFNTQNEKDLGGSKSINNIECNYHKHQDIGIEVKKYNTPDWMQCSIKYNTETNQWKGKIPSKSKNLFNQLLNNIKIFNGNISPFMKKSITHKEWITIKNKTDMWDDVYIDVPNDTIQKLYNAKKCQYIQISKGYGLYHLGDDVCNFNVPKLEIEQCIRIRTKIHTKKNKKGFCSLSVTVACQPKQIKLLNKSIYSLDDVSKLPKILCYNTIQ